MLAVSVISAEATLFEGQATAVVAPAFDGEVGILTNHAPMITALGTGTLRVEDGSATQRFSVSGGFLQVVENQVRIVTEQASISR